MDNPYTSPSSNPSQRDTFGTPSGAVTEGVVDQLSRTKGWARLNGVMAILLGGIFIVVGIFARQVFEKLGILGGGASQIAGTVIAVIYGGMGAMMIIGGVKLNGFSSSVARLLQSGREEDLEYALDRQRSFWLFTGIISIIGIIFMVIAIAGLVFTFRSAPNF